MKWKETCKHAMFNFMECKVTESNILEDNKLWTKKRPLKIGKEEQNKNKN